MNQPEQFVEKRMTNNKSTGSAVGENKFRNKRDNKTGFEAHTF